MHILKAHYEWQVLKNSKYIVEREMEFICITIMLTSQLCDIEQEF